MSYKTEYGFKYTTLEPTQINLFSGYQLQVAKSHIANCGKIIVYDTDNTRVVDNLELIEIYEYIKNL